MVHSFDVKIFEFSFVLFCYSVVNVGSAFTEAQPGSSLTALCFEIVCLLLRKIVERGFQILTLMNFREPLEIKCNFQHPSSSDSPLHSGRSNFLQNPYFSIPLEIKLHLFKIMKGFI